MTTEAEIGQRLLDRFEAATDDLIASVGDDQALGVRVRHWFEDRITSGPERWPVLAATFVVLQLTQDLLRRPDLNAPGVEQDGSGCSFCGKALGQVRHSFEGPGVRICDHCVDFCHDNPDVARSTLWPAPPRLPGP